MNIAPDKVVFTNEGFCELLREALRRDVLAYKPPEYTVCQVSHDDATNKWTVWLKTVEPAPKEVAHHAV